jgi:hypothetical protein
MNNNPISQFQQQVNPNNAIPQQAFTPGIIPPGYYPYMVPPATDMNTAFKKKSVIGQ